MVATTLTFILGLLVGYFSTKFKIKPFIEGPDPAMVASLKECEETLNHENLYKRDKNGRIIKEK